MSVIINNTTYFTGPLYTSSIKSYGNISIINTIQNVFINTQNISFNNLSTNNYYIYNISSNNTYIEIKKPFNFYSPSFDITKNYADVLSTLTMPTSGILYNTTTSLNMSTTKNYIINLSTYNFNDVSFSSYVKDQNTVNNYVLLNYFEITQYVDYYLSYLNIYNFGVYLIYSQFRIYTTDGSQPSNIQPQIYSALISDSPSNAYTAGYAYTQVPMVYNNIYTNNSEITLTNMQIFNITTHPSGKTFSTISLFVKFYNSLLNTFKIDMLNSALNINLNTFHFYAIKLS